MKTVIFSDVHGNFEALESVLTHASGSGAERYICLGDIVGYGASPNECVDRIRAIDGCICLRGNHDAAVVDESERQFFHEVALEGIQYTETEIADSNKEFLRTLPFVYDTDTFMAVHASPYHPQDWDYVLDEDGAQRAFGAMRDKRLAFIGHSHYPAIFCDDGTATHLMPCETTVLDVDEQRYIVNVGSVGQPRDGNPDACYALYDDDNSSIKLFRIGYDKEHAAEKILRAGLPPVLAERILSGN